MTEQNQNETTNFDELDHSDDWPDATVREDDVVLDDAGREFLEELEKRLNDFYESDEVQEYLKGANG